MSSTLVEILEAFETRLSARIIVTHAGQLGVSVGHAFMPLDDGFEGALAFGDEPRQFRARLNDLTVELLGFGCRGLVRGSRPLAFARQAFRLLRQLFNG